MELLFGMSRVGKKAIIIPEKVRVSFDDSARVVEISGPLGTLVCKLHEQVLLDVSDGTLRVRVVDESDRKQRAIWGTTRAVLQNLVTGVSVGFSKEVELDGVGYKMELQAAEKNLMVYVGFSHPVKVTIPDGISLDLQKQKSALVLVGKSADKQLLGNFFASLHNLRPCDPYKQKGFRFAGKHYLKKVGKKSGK